MDKRAGIDFVGTGMLVLPLMLGWGLGSMTAFAMGVAGLLLLQLLLVLCSEPPESMQAMELPSEETIARVNETSSGQAYCAAPLQQPRSKD